VSLLTSPFFSHTIVSILSFLSPEIKIKKEEKKKKKKKKREEDEEISLTRLQFIY